MITKLCFSHAGHAVKKNNRVIKMNATQCRMARAALGLGVRDLASLADVAQATVSRLERGEELKATTIQIIREALEAAGVEFIAENGGGAGVRLKK
ncbi:helix-turn-helix domain-containing protein [Mesobacterium hydrothermale]|nr:helix-turn-helix transcriptional regulator [Mesobacterium sp. TK19101]